MRGVWGWLKFCILQAQAISFVCNKGGSRPIKCLLLQSMVLAAKPCRLSTTHLLFRLDKHISRQWQVRDGKGDV